MQFSYYIRLRRVLSQRLPLALVLASCTPVDAVSDGSTDSKLFSSHDEEDAATEPTCGDGQLDSDEACDSSADGESNDTWHCSSSCREREIYMPCDELGVECSESSICGSTIDSQRGMCTPLTGLGLEETTVDEDSCPKLDGPYTQKRLSNVNCVIECDEDGERRCPPQIPRCVENPFKQAGPHEATRFCIP